MIKLHKMPHSFGTGNQNINRRVPSLRPAMADAALAVRRATPPNSFAGTFQPPLKGDSSASSKKTVYPYLYLCSSTPTL